MAKKYACENRNADFFIGTLEEIINWQDDFDCTFNSCSYYEVVDEVLTATDLIQSLTKKEK